MSFTKSLRKKSFSIAVSPLDRNQLTRFIVRAQAAAVKFRSTCGREGISKTAWDVFNALMYKFHNKKDGRCFPSYARIAEYAACCERSVGMAIKELEREGLLTWENRLKRARVWCEQTQKWRTRVLRTSNSYIFKTVVCGLAEIGLQASNGARRRGTEARNLMNLGRGSEKEKSGPATPDFSLIPCAPLGAWMRK